MERRKCTILLPIILFSLFMGGVAFALSEQDINDIYAVCSANHCETACGSILEATFCLCVNCKKPSNAEIISGGGDATGDRGLAMPATVYRTGNGQYLCTNNTDDRVQCFPFKFPTTALDLQNPPTTEMDKEAADQILRLRDLNAVPQSEMLAPSDSMRREQPPAKPAAPIFRRTPPSGR